MRFAIMRLPPLNIINYPIFLFHAVAMRDIFCIFADTKELYNS